MKKSLSAKLLLMTCALSYNCYASTSITVSCSIRTESYSDITNMDHMTKPATLSGRPNTTNGKAILLDEDGIELWIKTYGYTVSGNNIDISSYQIELIDRDKAISVSTTSSNAQGKMAELVLTDNFDKDQHGSIAITCFGNG